MTLTHLKQKLGALSLWKLVVGAFLVVTMIGQGVSLYDRISPKPLVSAPVTQVNDSTQALLAQIRREKDELRALQDAAKTLRGSLVAGLQITVKADTLRGSVVSAPTTSGADSTRYATRTDTAKGYTITVRAEAPPKGNLKLGYEIGTPEFRPQVGFVKRGDGYYGVVSWAGQNFTTTDAFYTEAKERPLSLRVGATAKGSPDDNALGATIRGDVYGALQYDIKRVSTQLRVGHDGRAYLGVNIEKKLW